METGWNFNSEELQTIFGLARSDSWENRPDNQHSEIGVRMKRARMGKETAVSMMAWEITQSVLLILAISVKAYELSMEEATIEEIQVAFSENKLTSRQLVDYYITRIHTLNPMLRSLLELNPDAQHQADEADRLRRSSSLGDLHGIPVLLKDSIATMDKMNTTAGSYALLGSLVPRDAGVVDKLRRAGAVILGKASMSEWYNLRSMHIPSGWCARSGQGMVCFFPLIFIFFITMFYINFGYVLSNHGF